MTDYAGSGEKGLPLPDPVDPGTFVEYHICIPDAWQYRSALVGAIVELCKYWNWQHTEQDISAAQEAAFLFKDAVNGAGYWEACMEFCERIIDCINNDQDVRQAFRDFVINDPAINTHIKEAAQLAVLTPGQQIENILKSGECRNDYLFNEATVLVDLLNTLSEDLLDAIVVGTNPAQRAELILSAIPAVGAVIPFDEILQFANVVTQDFQQDYLNKYDEALEDELRCGLFCLFQEDCEASILGAIVWYSEKAVVTLPPDPVECLKAVISLFVSGTLPGNLVVYLMHILVLSTVQAGQELIGVDFAKMAIRIIAAGDEPNNDWELICEECPPPTERIPVINSVWDPDHIAGTLSGPDEDGFWIATSTSRGTDQAVTIMDTAGRDFVFVDVTYDLVPACQVFLLDNVIIYIGCDSTNHYTGQTIDEWTATWISGTHTMRFKMVAPEE